MREHRELKCVLLVEDDEDIAEMMLFSLEGMGFQVEAAGDGLEAIEKLSAKAFDMVVSDLKMPRMDGFGLAKHIRESFHQLPMVLVTGFAEHDVREKALTLGVASVMEKPTDVETLQYEMEKTWSHIQ